jgi:hypothetical protein
MVSERGVIVAIGLQAFAVASECPSPVFAKLPRDEGSADQLFLIISSPQTADPT